MSFSYICAAGLMQPKGRWEFFIPSENTGKAMCSAVANSIPDLHQIRR